MARGFESKDVEYQQAEKEREKSLKRALTPGQREIQERRRTLELSVARARADCAAASSAAHRRMLEQAIEALEDQLGRLGGPAPE
jgi:hypothetical protein